MWRSQGLKILWEIRDELRREELPANSLIEGLLILVGGAFLVTPGFVTDGIGFVFLIPFTRRYLRSSLKSWVKQKIEKGEIDVYVHFDGNGLPGA